MATKMVCRCLLCKESLASLQDALNHHWKQHPKDQFSVLRPTYNSVNELLRYQKIHYNFCPNDIDGGISCMSVNQEEWTISFKNRLAPKEGTPDSKMSKMSATPQNSDIKKRCLFLDETIPYSDTNSEDECNLGEQMTRSIDEKQINITVPSKVDCAVDTSTLMDHSHDCTTLSDCEQHLVHELYSLFPYVVDFLKSEKKLDQWAMVFRLMKKGEFPAEGIATELFLDVVMWMSLDNPNQMRYSPKVKQFWCVGYKLFRERFLRFMGGYKNKGDVRCGEFKRGDLDVRNSRVNFVVPDAKVLRKEMASGVQTHRPGMIEENIDLMSSRSEAVSFKVCVDGKKISSGFGKNLGDVDLFGFEEHPTLRERLDLLQKELDVVHNLESVCRRFEERGWNVIHISDAPLVPPCLNSVMQIIHCKLKDLRHAFQKKSQALLFLKKSAGLKWRESKFAYAISNLETSKHRIQQTCKQLISLTDQLCDLIAMFNKTKGVYSTESVVDMNTQANYICLLGMENCALLQQDDTLQYAIMYSHFVQQKSPTWFAIRKRVKVTGSVLNKALGLSSIKEQREHYDCVINGKTPPPFSKNAQEAMAHGTANEANAVATIVGKILPVLRPNLKFYEVGCYVLYQNGEPFMAVSPDGVGKPHDNGPNELAFEIKCPLPGKQFTTDQHYSIPKYYIPQLLAEMKALACNKLLYVCYTPESTTVFEVVNNPQLWDMMWENITVMYASDSKKPTRRTEMTKEIAKQIEDFQKHNVEYLGEFPSVRCNPCKHTDTEKNGDQVHGSHCGINEPTVERLSLDVLKNLSFQVEQIIEETYNLMRLPAKEVDVVMLADVDRFQVADAPSAVPVAYGLSGFSLKTENIREMLNYVIGRCNLRDLHVPIVSYDGQFYRLAVRDAKQKPLTVLQLQKDVWLKTKAMPKNVQLSTIIRRNHVEVESFEELVAVVDLDLSTNEKAEIVGPIIVRGISDSSEKVLMRPVNLNKWISKSTNTEKQSDASDVEVEDYILPYIPCEVLDQLDEAALRKVEELNLELHEMMQKKRVEEDNSSSSEATTLADSFMNMNNAEWIDDQSPTAANGERDNVQAEEGTCRRQQFLCEFRAALQAESHRRSKNWSSISEEDFANVFKSPDVISSSLTKPELIIGLELALRIMPPVAFKPSWQKYRLVNVLCDVTGLESHQVPPVKKRKMLSLRQLAKDVISQKYPKMALNIILASNNFPDELADWQDKSKYNASTTIDELGRTLVWYSQPDFNDEVGQHQYSLLDCHHLFVNARCTVCSHGILDRGINKQAWIDVASRSKDNGTGLSLAMVVDLADRQSNAFAQTTFSLKVQEQMRELGWHNEAKFCELIRRWYEAEDDAGISAVERCQRRISFRDFLLQGAPLGLFPPPGKKVGDVPVVMFEGILTNIDRRIQLFTEVKGGAYNVRALGSLESETIFSTFQDLDPKGSGVLLPDDVPKVLTTASFLAHAHLCEDRGFHMHTSAKKVYPMHELLNPAVAPSHFVQTDTSTALQTLTIKIRDHAFDQEDRKKKRPKRKRGTVQGIDLPSRGTRPVREHHHFDESKVLPHIRQGLNLSDF